METLFYLSILALALVIGEMLARLFDTVGKDL